MVPYPDNFSDAFDLTINDTLSLGMVFNGGLTVSGVGNTIAAPVITPVGADGIAIAENLSWSLANVNADIDVAEGTSVIMTYETIVLDEVLANQALTNSATIQWTSIDGPDANERDGSAVPVVNDYFTAPATTNTASSDNNTIVKTRLSDTFNAADNIVRIGDIVEYELRLTIQEGTSPAIEVVDTLPKGLMFTEVVSINGDTSANYDQVAPFTHNPILATDIAVLGNAELADTTVTWNIGDVVNVANNNAVDDVFIIVYRAQVLNDDVFLQANPTVPPLINSANFDYTTAAGPAVTENDTETIDLRQPILTVDKTAVPAGGVTVDDPANTIIEADEVITYTIEIFNGGTAPAYDVVLNDVIPAGLRNGALTITVDSISLAVGGARPILNPVYNAATGLAVWDFDTGVGNTGLDDPYTIPANDTLIIVYRVQAEPGIGAGLALDNAATATLYYSFDNNAVPAGAVAADREIYGPSNTAIVSLTTGNPNALLKENPLQLTQTIGESFTYRITIPDAPMPTSLYDVQITDDLSTLPGAMTLISVVRVPDALPQTWVPENVGTPTNLLIQDLATGSGIDIPPNEQIAIDVTVQLQNLPLATNVAGLTFINSADYTFNQVDDVGPRVNGGSDDTPIMTITEPLVLVTDKSGPAQMTFGTPEVFTIDVENNTAANPNASAATI